LVPALPQVLPAQADLVLAGLLALPELAVVVRVAVLAAAVGQLALQALQQLARLALQVPVVLPVALVEVLPVLPARLVLSLVVAVVVAVVPAMAWILRRATLWSAAAAASTPMPSTLTRPRIQQPMWAKTASSWNR